MQPSGGNTTSAPTSCYTCGSEGHIARQCFTNPLEMGYDEMEHVPVFEGNGEGNVDYVADWVRTVSEC